MNRLCEYPKFVDVDSEDAEDPEQLLNEWLGELDNLTGVSRFLFYIFIYFIIIVQFLTNKHCS